MSTISTRGQHKTKVFRTFLPVTTLTNGSKSTATASNEGPRTRAQVRLLGLQLQHLTDRNEATTETAPKATVRHKFGQPASSKQQRPTTRVKLNSTTHPLTSSFAKRAVLTKSRKIVKSSTRQTHQVEPQGEVSFKPAQHTSTTLTPSGPRRSTRIANLQVKEKREETKAFNPPSRTDPSGQVGWTLSNNRRSTRKTLQQKEDSSQLRSPAKPATNPSRSRVQALARVSDSRLKCNSAINRSKADLTYEEAPELNANSQAKTKITSWLSNVTAGNVSLPVQPPPDLSFQMPARRQNTYGGRDSSSSATNASNSSSIIQDDGKSGRTSTTAKPKASAVPDDLCLNQRHIATEAAADPNLDDFNLRDEIKIPVRQLSLSSFQDYLKLCEENLKILRELIPVDSQQSNFSTSDAFDGYDSSLQGFFEWRPPGATHRCWPGVTANQFTFDRSNCSASNEADFQRTIMMSLIDRYDFQDCFAFSCEDQWETKNNPLPTVPDPVKSTLPVPKPDLMICFQGTAIEPDWRNRSLVPKELVPYLYPAANRDLKKMVPFFFVEAKKRDSSLQAGFKRNLISASHALYNIYQLFRPFSDLVKRFPNEVRVFSLDANVSVMNLRIHRAKVMNDGSGDLTYDFYELQPLTNYDRHSGCHLVKLVLLSYAKEKLLPIIREVFQRILSINHPQGASSDAEGYGSKRKHLGPGHEGIMQDVDDAGDLPQGIESGGSQTPRLQSLSTGTTESFRSELDLDEPDAQPSPKRPKAFGASVRKARKG